MPVHKDLLFRSHGSAWEWETREALLRVKEQGVEVEPPKWETIRCHPMEVTEAKGTVRLSRRGHVSCTVVAEEAVLETMLQAQGGRVQETEMAAML
jgi:hypothetical protein